MARKCDLTGKTKQKGNKVSHSQRKTIKHFKPNLRKVKVVENGTAKTIKVSMKMYKKIKAGKVPGIKLNDKRARTKEANVN